MMSLRSNLNPLASTFIPSNVTGASTEAEALHSSSEVFSTKSILLTAIAADYVKKITKYKEEREEYSITRSELLHIILRLFSLYRKIKTRRELMRIVAFFWNKIPIELSIKGIPSKSLKTKIRRFDFSVCRIPAPTILLVAFFGLYRHEQAFRPLLSLAHRPKAFEDKVWSLTEEDLKLWNRSVVQPCGCPPMFGYHIPDNFFGNPFKFNHPCSKKQIHLSCSGESSQSNEFILLDSTRNDQVADTVFVDFEEKLDQATKFDLDYYSKQMKEIVHSVYSIIDDYDPDKNATEDLTENSTESLIEYVTHDCNSNVVNSLWNTSDSELNKPPSSDELVDDDHHPLLDAGYEDPVEEISMEVKEILRRSFPKEWGTSVESSSCDPPCSVWCSKLEKSSPLHNGRKSDSSAIKKLNETAELVTDISCRGALLFKRTFKRSFSANDSVYCDTTVPLQSVMSLDPGNFTTFSRRSSNDSGIMSMSSQEEDFAYEDDSGDDSIDKAPMWTLFSGEHSLWKPLPVTEMPKSSHKRARDLKRQTSSVN